MAVIVGSGEFVVRTVFEKDVNFEPLSEKFKQNFDQATQTLDQFERRFLDVQKAVSLGLVSGQAADPFLQKQLASLKSLGGDTASLTAQAKAVQQLQAQYNLLNRTLVDSAAKTAVLNRLQAQARGLGGDLTGNIGRVGAAAAGAAGGMNILERAGGKVDKALGKFGLTMRDLNVIIGSGFLSTAGPALAILLGVAIVGAAAKAAVAIAKLGDQLLTFRARLVSGFGESAGIIQSFSQNIATSFGLTEVAAIKLTGTIGNLFKSFGIGNQEAAEFAVDLAEAARIIQKTSFTADTYEQVLTKLQGSLTGNIEALREYGIAVNETSLRETARAHGIRLLGGELDAGMKALLAQRFILDQVKLRLDEYGNSTDSLSSAQERLTAEFQNMQAELGTALVPAFLELVEKGRDFLQFVNESIEGFRRWSSENREAAAALELVLQALIPITNPALWETAGGAIEAIGKSLGALGDSFQFAIDQFNRFAEVIPGLDSESEKAAKAAEEAGERIRKAFELEPPGEDFNPIKGGGLGFFIRELERLGEITAGGASDGLKGFGDVLDEQLERFKQGKITAEEFFLVLAGMTDLSPEELQQAFKEQFDGLVKLHPELEKYRSELAGVKFEEEKLNKAIRDRQAAQMEDPKFLKQLVDAYQSLSDVIEENAERLKDAQEAVREARIEGDKAVADAQKDLGDARRKGAKDIVKAEKDKRDAEEDRIEAIADAREALREAEKDEREQVKDAEESLRDARIDAAKRVDDAERKLSDARRKRADAITDALISLEQAQRKGDVFAERSAALALSRAKQDRSIEDARRALVEARVEGNEKIQDAQEKLAEAVEKAAEKVADAQEKLADTIEDQDERVADSAERLAEVRERVAERIIDAQEKLDEAELKAIERLEEAKEKLVEVKEENEKRLTAAIEKVQELEGTWIDVNTQVAIYKRQLAELRGELGTFTVAEDGSIVTSDFFKKRQHGGPVRAGNPYLVGERGLPELFIPNTSGTVVSNDQLIRALKQMSGNTGNSQSITVVDSGDPEATAFAVAHRIMSGVNN